MPPKIRKYDSGHDKRMKKKRIETLVESQRGSLNKFIIRNPKVSDENQNRDDVGAEIGFNNVENDHVNDVPIENDNVNELFVENDNISEVRVVNDSGDKNLNDISNKNESDEEANLSHNLPNVYDPRTWDGLDSKMIEVLVQKGPKRDGCLTKGPKDKFSRRFTTNLYTRVLSNGEKLDRDWLIYSKELDRIFCFCCKIFKRGIGRGQLTNEGFSDWGHVGLRLKEHETSIEHVKNMTTWYELRIRFQTNQTIDKAAQALIEKEKDHWKKVLHRVISIIKYLAKHNLAFRGSNARLYQNSNGNFLGLVEMLAEFDPIVIEHVRRVTNNEISSHYLGHNIQNELILLLGSTIKTEIIKKVKQAKYFSVILDCTPDVSHQEQMSLILRYVDISSNRVVIEESFLGFLNVNDTTGHGLFDVLQNELKNLDLDISDVRGQGYDNGSNMKGKHQGVQKRLLEINNRAFYTPCGCHSLNLTLCDMANACSKARDFFGVIQRIYTIFACSTKRWQILKDNVKGLTLKSLSSTRWESRIDSVKAIRFQMLEIREALLQVADVDNDSKVKSEAKSLATNELGDFEFLIGIIIWYEILCAINTVSKILQPKDMLIDVAIKKIEGLISFFENYRETGFNDAVNSAKKLAIEMDIDPSFPQRREIRRKKHFDENAGTSPVAPLSGEEFFRVNYFLYVVDQAISSLNRRFEQYKEYESIFGFLFTSDKFKSLDDISLKNSCTQFENALTHDGQSDIDATELCIELKLFRDILPNDILGALDVLKFLKDLDCFPNVTIAYRILLTIPVTVASAERSFSKLKLLKSYLRSTMLQDRLNGLALIAIENEILDKVEYEDLIDDFASKSVRRIALFK
ncbi:TTF-type domain-containing protein [Heracleum sosnowskyi]|uniref:TTF-type domain-containing protein n=1 Tax=Heracleum sosnowskyi TaxID=360622 RepID=A0AAD8JB77_9APIA|nr:TTF-type domain-containing protein [Heracleum sosnowskyi]